MLRTLAVVLLVLGAAAPPAPARAEAQREPGWEVRIPERLEVLAGETGVLPIAIAVDRGLAISKDAPVIVDLAATGVAIKKTRLGRADAVDPGADAPRFAVTVKPTAAGEHVVKVHLRLWLCGGKACRPLDIRRQATVVGVAPAPDDAAGVTP
jgi:hypothetical protein